jgi:hypothetical protein
MKFMIIHQQFYQSFVIMEGQMKAKWGFRIVCIFYTK